MEIDSTFISAILKGWEVHQDNYVPHLSSPKDKVLFLLILGRKAYREDPERWPTLTLTYYTSVPVGQDPVGYAKKESSSFSTTMSRLIKSLREDSNQPIAVFKIKHNSTELIPREGMEGEYLLSVTKTYVPDPIRDSLSATFHKAQEYLS